LGLSAPWALKRLDPNLRRHLPKFPSYCACNPRCLRPRSRSQDRAGDENNQKISLAGRLSVDHPSGEFFLARTRRCLVLSGVLTARPRAISISVRRCSKAPIKELHRLLKRRRKAMISVPRILRHDVPRHSSSHIRTSRVEWQGFRSNRNKTSLHRPICVIKVTYCLRSTEEIAHLREAAGKQRALGESLRDLARSLCWPGSAATASKQHEKSKI